MSAISPISISTSSKSSGFSGVHLVGTSLGRLDRRGTRRSQSNFARDTHACGGRWPAREGRSERRYLHVACPELARNLFHDQKYAEWMLLAEPSEEEQDMQLKNRLTTAKLGWQPRLYNPHLAKWLHRITDSHADCVGSRRQADPCAICVRRFATRFPSARLEIFENCGHLAADRKDRRSSWPR